jgi:hypothetical protein
MIEKMTKRQQNCFEAYMQGCSWAECARRSGSKAKTSESLSVIGLRLFRSLDVDPQEILELNGVTDKKLSQVVSEGLDAQKVVVATYEGKIGEEKAYPDYSTRSKYVELAGRMKGRFIDRHEVSGKDGGDIILSVKPAGTKKKGLTLDLDE